MAAQHPTAAVLLCEVVMEILSWIPAKPVTRLKLVCKSWNSIISHPHFLKLHLHRSPKNAILLFTQTKALTLGEEEKQGLVLSSVESFIQNPSSSLDTQENRHSLHVEDWVSGSCNGFGGSSWKTINSLPAFLYFAEDTSGHFIGGTLNWLALRNLHGDDYDWADVTLDMLMIVSFDLKSDTHKQILLPKGIDEIPGQKPILGVWGNSLYLLHDYKNTHFIAWQMKEFGDENSWTQLLKISFHHLGVETLFPEFIFENGNIFMLIGRHRFEEVFYDRRDNSVKRVNILANNCYFEAFDYVESLIQPC
ncbi:hypothetical protein HN51_060687 [Arachis hypogaea]